MLNTVRVPKEVAPVFEQAQSYVREYFSQALFDPEKGAINISGQRYTLVRAGSLSVEFFDLVRGLHPEQDEQEAASMARTLLFDLAHAMGISDARVFAQRMQVEDPIERLSAGPIHFAHAGWAFVDILPESNPVAGDDFVLIYDHPNSFEAEAWMAAGKSTTRPVCVMNAGYSSGWCASSFSTPLVATEITCRAKGDPYCRFVMAPPERIEMQIERYLAANPEVAHHATKHETPSFFTRITAARTLRETAQQLGAANAELERRVEARTNELLELNSKLERELVERREAEAALRRSQAYTQQVQEVMPGGIVRVAPDGAILEANRNALSFLGLKHDELTQRYTTDFETETIHEDGSVARHEEYPVAIALGGGESPPRILGVRRPDGFVAWGMFRAKPIRDPETNAVTGAVVTFLDITERKAEEDARRRLETKMQQSQKLESLGVLAGGIAHDFNNLLVGVLGHASLLAETLPAGSPEKQSVEQIELAASRAAELTKQMLAYSGRGRVQKATVELSQLTREMLRLLTVSVPANVQVRTEFGDDLPAVEGDPAQLQQVVMNLILNAAEAMGSRGGCVLVSTREHQLDAEQLSAMREAEFAKPGRYVSFVVEDNGSGMDDTTLASIFDPFFTTKEAGQGLGLAAVLGIVRGHRGALSLRSSRGEGTRFEVFFPASDQLAEAAEPSSRPAAEAQHGAVLVADDEDLVRSLAEAALREVGFEVLCADNGKDAVELFRARAEDVRCVLLDLTMPGLDGIAALKEIRGIRPDTLAILSSGYDRGEVMKHFEGGSGIEFLPKPFRARELAEVVQRLLKAQGQPGVP